MVQDPGGRAGLDELNGFVGVDIKALVVDDAVVARVDGGKCSALVEGNIAVDDVRALGCREE